jgi:F-type H+-transporting ATPase subunit b
MLDTLGIDPRFLVVQVVGFLILIFVLSKYAFGPLLAVLEERQTTIRNNLDEAESRRNEMARLQNVYEERLAKIEDEARDKIQAAVREAQVARDEIIARAHADSQAVLLRGTQELDQERSKAMEEMRNEIADLAVQAAGRVIKANLDSASHAALIADVIHSVGASNGQTTGSTL